MENSFRKIVYCIIALVSIALIIYANTRPISFADGPIALGDWHPMIEVANTETKQEQGLSGRDKLDMNAGMLFVFPEVGTPGFWMKDMQFPLDLIFFNANAEIVEILSDVAPSTYPQIFTPAGPIKYVLEINAGQARAHGLDVGDKMSQSEE